MTPREVITAWAVEHGGYAEEKQEDDGSGYEVLTVSCLQGEFDVTIDSGFKDGPGGMDISTGRSPEDDWLN